MCFLPSREVGVISFYELRPFGSRMEVKLVGGGRVSFYISQL